MNTFTIYVTSIFIIKIIFIFLAILLVYSKNKNPENKNLIEFLKFWKERVEFVFKAMMSFMLIYIFNPRSDNIKLIDREVKILLFLFGFILIITENWHIFFEESPIFIKFQKNK
jgi:hypothetical protein